jgi:putative SOS response-associated peptidase YedK
MCGRFSQAQIAELDREVFRLLEMPALEPRYNIAPTQDVAVIRQRANGERVMQLLRWGLIPHWAKDPAIGNRMINARAETLATKPAFKRPFLRQRCLVPADGFYEWKRTGTAKQPYYLRRSDGGPLAFAGLWDRWQEDSDAAIDSFTIVTTTPNDLVAPIHNRMPAILLPDRYDMWLDPENRDVDDLGSLLGPYPAEEMTAYPVSRFVNNPRNEGPECVSPASG